MLEERLSEGRLFVWTPQIIGDPCVRTLFITDQLNEQFDEEYWVDQNVAARLGQLSSDFDRFVTGDMLSVGWDPYDKGGTAFMARLDPIEYGMWSIRSVAPSPAVRVFGSFYEKDVFVALTAKFRRDLDGPRGRKWANAREDASALWDDLFAAKSRLVGETVDDFITEKKIIV